MRRDVVQASTMDLRNRGQTGGSRYRQGRYRRIEKADNYHESKCSRNFNNCKFANLDLFKGLKHLLIAKYDGEMQEIKEDLESHSRPVSTCLDQIRQVVLTGSNVLSSDEVCTLEKNGRSLKTRFDKALDRTDKLVKRLTSARDELTKFK